MLEVLGFRALGSRILLWENDCSGPRTGPEVVCKVYLESQ